MINRVEIEGLDRMGKDTLMGYIDYMSNRTMVVKTRGVLSNLVFADYFERDLSPNRINQLIEGNKDTLIIYLMADKEDWDIRMKISNHQEINYEGMSIAFNIWKKKLLDRGIMIYEFNTSKETPYQIARKIIAVIKEVNDENKTI